MRDFRWLKIVLIMVLGASFLAPQVQAQKKDKAYKEAKKWYKSGVWRQGFQPSAQKTCDYVEFQSQYNKNPELWEKLFQWLASHDLEMIAPGTYQIQGKHCYVKVSDVETLPVAQCKVESHRKYIDLQYVARGTERFGRVKDAQKATPIAPYRPDIIHYNCDKVIYMDSKPSEFFLFFPSDLHLAMGQAGYEPEMVRLIVAKIEYKE